MKLYKDRQEAGQLLGERLKDFAHGSDSIVLAIPRGGVVVAREIAKKLNLPLNIVLVRKIGAPGQKELALGAVDADGEVVWDEGLLEQLDLTAEDLKSEIAQEMEEIKRREKLYRQGERLLNIENKVVILVDDGIATGSTILSAIKYLQAHGAKQIIVAVPVSSNETFKKVAKEVKIVVLNLPDPFQAVGQFYENFQPVEDQKVIRLLK